MPRVIVEVMPKAELLDPQGKAITRALARFETDSLNGLVITTVRQGKRFEVTTADPVTAEVLTQIRHLAETVLANTVIEDVVSVRLADEDTSPEGESTENSAPCA